MVYIQTILIHYSYKVKDILHVQSPVLYNQLFYYKLFQDPLEVG